MRIEFLNSSNSPKLIKLIMSVLETGEADSSVLDASQAAVDVA